MSIYHPKEDPEGINSPKNSGLMDFFVLIGGFAAIFITVLYGLIYLGEQVAAQMNPEIEQKVFSTLKLPMENSAPLPSAVKNLAERLSTHIDFKADIGVLCQKHPNAFALPGRKILLTSELLNNIQSERGLAFVIAHELGHFTHRDHLRNLGRVFAVLMTDLLLGGSSQEFGPTSTLQTLVARSFDRDQESAADAYALELMKKTFQTIHGSSEFFQYLSSLESVDKNSPPTFLSTHPQVNDRLQWILREEAKEPPPPLSASDRMDLRQEMKSVCP